ncbi:unnamed protein product, partial [Amoebophrya sp. A120]
LWLLGVVSLLQQLRGGSRPSSYEEADATPIGPSDKPQRRWRNYWRPIPLRGPVPLISLALWPWACISGHMPRSPIPRLGLTYHQLLVGILTAL